MRCAQDVMARAGSREPPPAEEEEPVEEEGDGPKEPKPPKIVYPPYEEPGTPRPAERSSLCCS